MFFRKGVSAVVANVLIILLVVVGVALIWTAVRPALKQGTDEVQNDCFTLNVKPVKCVYTTGGFAIDNNGEAYLPNAKLDITLQRNAGKGNFENVKFIINSNVYDITSDGQGGYIGDQGSKEFVFDKLVSNFNELETKTFTISPAEITSQTGSNQLLFQPAKSANVALVAGDNKNVCHVITSPISCECDDSLVGSTYLGFLCP